MATLEQCQACCLSVILCKSGQWWLRWGGTLQDSKDTGQLAPGALQLTSLSRDMVSPWSFTNTSLSPARICASLTALRCSTRCCAPLLSTVNKPPNRATPSRFMIRFCRPEPSDAARLEACMGGGVKICRKAHGQVCVGQQLRMYT